MMKVLSNRNNRTKNIYTAYFNKIRWGLTLLLIKYMQNRRKEETVVIFGYIPKVILTKKSKLVLLKAKYYLKKIKQSFASIFYKTILMSYKQILAFYKDKAIIQISSNTLKINTIIKELWEQFNEVVFIYILKFYKISLRVYILNLLIRIFLNLCDCICGVHHEYRRKSV